MKDSTSIVLFLTACVNPANMSKTALINPQVRLSQYIDAIRFYIDNTRFKILLVENTNFDLTPFFLDEIKYGRLEFLKFNGNNYNPLLGKGYGEGKILEYGFKNSIFINNANVVIKITGRQQILNINLIVSSILNIRKSKFIALDIICKKKFASSGFVIADKTFYTDYFIPNIEKINDNIDYYFENLLFDSLCAFVGDGNKFIQFPFPYKIDGYSGTTGKIIPKPSFIRSIKTFLKFVYYMFKYPKLMT